MKKLLIVLMVLCGVFTVWGNAFSQCTSTGFPTNPTTGNPLLTAALVNPSGTVKGTVDATGCGVGVYYGPGKKGKIDGANIINAVYYGVLVNDASVDVVDSTISIGVANLWGPIDYRPIGVFYINGDKKTHKIEGNTINLLDYGKGGIIAKNPTTHVNISGNTINGFGPNSTIASNGIEIGDGAHAQITDNVVKANQYSLTDTNATGILIFGGPGFGSGGVFGGSHYTGNVTVRDNILTNNDVGIYLSNANTGQLVPNKTSNDIEDNEISNDGTSLNIYNTGIVYASGNGDTIKTNTIYGAGY